MKKIILPLLALLLTTIAASAQNVPLDSSEHYAIAAWVKEGTVTLRWGPRDFGVWQLANKNGYILERAVLPKTTVKDPADYSKIPYQALGTFRPYSLKDWKSRTDTTQIANVTAAQALYGKADYTPATGGGGMGALRQQSMEQNMRHAFALYAADLLPQTAEALGLRFEDKDISKDNRYIYRIFNLPSKKGYLTDTAYVVVDPANISVVPTVKTIFLEEMDSKIKVQWSKVVNRTKFTAYHVEKSLDGGKTFQRISKLPITFDFGAYQPDDFYFVDTQVVNEVKYHYRVLGITAFGELSQPSESVSGSGKDLSGSMPPTSLWANDIGGKFEITWKNPEQQVDDHAGWYVARSVNATGPFSYLHEKPLDKNLLKFVDESPIPLLPNYYVVYAADDKDNLNQSPVIMGVHNDSEPPKKPNGLSGVSDSTGLITLQWAENQEIDLMGYRVYMATARDRDWFQLTSEPTPKSTFQTRVPLNTLTEKVYFTVVALDFHYNPSEYAETAEVLLPDTIAPEKPLFLHYFVDEKGIHLEWARSNSTDLKTIHLLRQSENQSTWTTLADVTNSKTNTYTDTTARIGQTYRYAVEATDNAGLKSGTEQALRIEAVDNFIRPGVTRIQGQYDKAKKLFSLGWEYKPQGRYNFVIYRATTGQTPETIAQIAGTERVFADDSLTSQKEGYEYFVKVIWADGGESDLSEPFEVRFTNGK
jgi:fibronectin type 3 domain-containing protein